MYGNDDYLYSLTEEEFKVYAKAWEGSWLPILLFVIYMFILIILILL